MKADLSIMQKHGMISGYGSYNAGMFFFAGSERIADVKTERRCILILYRTLRTSNQGIIAGAAPLTRLFVKSVTSMVLIPYLPLLMYKQVHNRG